MTTQNKNFTFNITAPGGGGGTVLANAASALSSGQFGTFTVGNVLDNDPTNVGDSITSYGSKLVWDPINDRLIHWGGSHGASGTVQRGYVSIYNESTNNWTQTPIPNGSGQYSHGYNMGSLDRTNGNLYGGLAFMNAEQIRRLTPGGSWTSSFATAPSWGNITYAWEYHPNLFGGAGGFVAVSELGIRTWNHNTNAWTTIHTGGSYGGYQQVCAYNAKDDCVYLGGGNGSNVIYKVTAAEVVSQIAAAPSSVGIWDDFGASSILVASGNSANRLTLMNRDGDVWEYDEVGNSWSSVTTLPSAIHNGPSNGWVAGPCSKHGCIVFFKPATSDSNSTMSVTGHIWKR